MTDSVTEEQAKQIAEEAAMKAVEGVLQRLGIDATEPLEAQKDFQYLNAQRRASERIGLMVRLGLISTVTTGLVSAVWLGIKSSFN